MSVYNNKLWNSGTESDKEIARKQKRKLSYYSNIYVVRDPKNPENEGKVFLYRYGKKIFDKIMAAMKPEFQDETPVNPFDFWEGADFKLKIKTVAGFWNYDSSEFAAPAALSGDDEVLENIYKSEHSLEAFTAPSEFKTYEALEERLNLVLGLSAAPQRPSVDDEEYEPQPVAQSPFRERMSAPAAPASGGFNDSDITPKLQLMMTMPCLTSLALLRRTDGRCTRMELHVLRGGVPLLPVGHRNVLH